MMKESQKNGENHHFLKKNVDSLSMSKIVVVISSWKKGQKSAHNLKKIDNKFKLFFSTLSCKVFGRKTQENR